MEGFDPREEIEKARQDPRGYTEKLIKEYPKIIETMKQWDENIKEEDRKLALMEAGLITRPFDRDFYDRVFLEQKYDKEEFERKKVLCDLAVKYLKEMEEKIKNGEDPLC